MKHWYAVYTQPQKEWLANEHLERQGFDVFLPRYLKRRTHARKVEDVPAPLFPRYLFAAFDIADPAWRVIRSTRGVIDLVRNGLEPIAVPRGIVEEMRERQDARGFVPLVRRSELKEGMRVRIESGPFAEYEALFQTMRDEERVVALLSLFGRKVKTQVPLESLVSV